MPCDFCRSPLQRWRYPATGQDWLACDKCHTAIQGDDREALLERVLLAPVPRTVRDRYAPRYQQRARELHETFWSAGVGAAEPIRPE